MEPAALGKHTLESLARYIRYLVPTWKFDFKGKGRKRDKSPNVIILSASALRATDVIKHVSPFHCKVLKLFARHLKVEDQTELLAKQFHPLAIGTPGRVKKLLEINALSLAHTTHLVIDMHRDSKNMTVLELKDTVKEVIDIVQFYALPRLNNGTLKLVLY